MQTVLIVIHLIIVLALVGIVLIQRSEGGGLGLGGGGGGVSGFMTGRGQTNALTRTTAILATLFFLTSLGLTLLATHTRTSNSILDGLPGASQKAPADAPPIGGAPASAPDFYKQLQKMQGGDKPAPAAPVAPATPQVPTNQ